VITSELRSARLLFASELLQGVVTEADLERREVRRAVRETRTPFPARRAAQRLAMKSGLLRYESACARPLQEARRAVLGDAADGLPRVLLRVDEFPHFRVLDEPLRYASSVFERFHSILAERGIAYLLSALPVISARPLDPSAAGRRALTGDEAETLRRVADDGVTLALHGLDHRTRDARPTRRSELDGLSAMALQERLAAAEGTLAELGLGPVRAFVAPYNRFDACQYPLLAERYAVVTGGPETVRRLGYARTPMWRGDAVYVPAYPPLYGTAAAVTDALRSLIRQRCAVWVPAVIHWGWEADRGLKELRALAEVLETCAVSWDSFLASVEASRSPCRSEGRMTVTSGGGALG
jgi:hypothetical protein